MVEYETTQLVPSTETIFFVLSSANPLPFIVNYAPWKLPDKGVKEYIAGTIVNW